MQIPTGTRVVLIRHAESEGNAHQVMQGAGEYPLSPRGREQAIQAFPTLAAWPIALVAASNLSRAQDTALLATGRLDTVDERLRERSAGHWEGKPRAELEALHPGALENDNLRPDGFEATSDVEHRMRAASEDLANHGGLVAAFTHGAALRVLAKALGADARRFAHLEGLCLDANLSALGRVHILNEGHGS